jgi:hypothetical protein
MLERFGEAARELGVSDRVLEVPSHAPSSVPADTLTLRCLLALDLFARPSSGLGLSGHRLHRTRPRPSIDAVTIDGMPDGERGFAATKPLARKIAGATRNGRCSRRTSPVSVACHDVITRSVAHAFRRPNG